MFVQPGEQRGRSRAQGNYVLLQQRAGSYLLRESISTMAEKLSRTALSAFTDRCL